MSRLPRARRPDRLPPALALVLLCAVAAAAQAPAPAPTAADPNLFRAARALPESLEPGADGPEAFTFEQDGFQYQILHNGAGRRTKEGAVRLFNLRLEAGDRLRHVYFSEFVNNIILACEVSDAETGAGFVVRLEQPSMRARWKAHLPGFNVGAPLRDGEHLYLTAIGFVAKLDLKTGRFAWRHTRLHGRGGPDAFSAFGPPELSGDAVLFRETRADGRPARAVRVHRRTGKILGLEGEESSRQ
jgi:hypothetical protein